MRGVMKPTLSVMKPTLSVMKPTNTHCGTCHRANSRSADRQKIQGSRLPAHAAAQPQR